MNEIKTNDRFDRLTNLDISTQHRDIEFYALPSEFSAAFAYWVIVQNPNRALIDIRLALTAFNHHVLTFFEKPTIPEQFDFARLQGVINEDAFASIPDILALNELKPDFIDLGALARNIFYMILREHITQD
jgi:hypothetical protein